MAAMALVHTMQQPKITGCKVYNTGCSTITEQQINALITYRSMLEKYLPFRKIESGGQISFSEFMDMALYYPSLGYYNSDKVKSEARRLLYKSCFKFVIWRNHRAANRRNVVCIGKKTVYHC